MFALSFPDSFGSISRPLLASMSIPPLLFGLSFVELCTFPVQVFLAFFRLSPLSLVSTRIMKSSFFRLSFLNVLSLYLCCPNPFTFKDLNLICDILFLFCSFFPHFGSQCVLSFLCFMCIVLLVCLWFLVYLGFSVFRKLNFGTKFVYNVACIIVLSLFSFIVGFCYPYTIIPFRATWASIYCWVLL